MPLLRAAQDSQALYRSSSILRRPIEDLVDWNRLLRWRRLYLACQGLALRSWATEGHRRRRSDYWRICCSEVVDRHKQQVASRCSSWWPVVLLLLLLLLLLWGWQADERARLYRPIGRRKSILIDFQYFVVVVVQGKSWKSFTELKSHWDRVRILTWDWGALRNNTAIMRSILRFLLLYYFMLSQWILYLFKSWSQPDQFNSSICICRKKTALHSPLSIWNIKIALPCTCTTTLLSATRPNMTNKACVSI